MKVTNLFRAKSYVSGLEAKVVAEAVEPTKESTAPDHDVGSH